MQKKSDISKEELLDIKAMILDEFKFVTKIDTVICTLDDVMNHPNEWGFWVKIVCVNIHGTDMGNLVPPIQVNNQFVIDLNSDTKQAVNRVRNALLKATDDKMKRRYVKGYSKRLIRAMFSLVLERAGEWHDDIAKMVELIIEYLDIDADLLEYLYEAYVNNDVNINEFIDKADEAFFHFDTSLKNMSSE